MGAAVAAGLAATIAVGTLLAPLFLVGPIAAAVAGAASGTLLSGAKNWGINEDTSRSYQQRIEEGSVLVLVMPREIDCWRPKRVCARLTRSASKVMAPKCPRSVGKTRRSGPGTTND